MSSSQSMDSVSSPVDFVTVQSLVREIGVNIIPTHIRHSFDSILQILDTVSRLRHFDQEPYNSYLLMLVALVRHAQNQTATLTSSSRYSLALENGLSDVSPRTFQRDRKFAKYAVDIYAASWNLSTAEVALTMGVLEEDIVMKWFNDDMDEHCPKFIILLDHAAHSVVLVIRGTFSFKDVIMDVVCEEHPFLDGFAHKGMLEGSMKVLEKSRRILQKTLRDHFGYTLVVAGHSMGGGTAELITLEFLLGSRSSSILPPGVEVRCVALGPPPVYRSQTEIPARVRERVEIYINNRDVVPRLSLGSVARLLAMLRAVDSLGLSLEQQLGVLMWGDGGEVEGHRERVVSCVRGVRQERFPYLDHPGQVTRLTTCSGGVKAMQETDRDLASNMEVFETMISDHLHTTYRDTFLQDTVL